MRSISRGPGFWLIVLGFVLMIGAGDVAAEERSLDFSSTVLIDPDGSLLVSEDITVRSEGDQIKRGSVREFPTIYRGAEGRTVRVGF